jgi:CDP-diacylglycerol--serine O-phosphatidyltransferase
MRRPSAVRRPRAKMPLVQLIPNMITLTSIGAGLTGVRAAMHGQFRLAVTLIVLAALLDAIDGRIARILGSESAIGAELDSLADFFNFGVAPALTLYLWGLQGDRDVGWAGVLIYAICCALRLARFNVTAKSETGGDPRFFTGVPAPAAALLVMLPLYLAYGSASGLDPLRLPVIGISSYMVAIGALMISTLPTWSTKSVTIYADHARLALGAGAVIAALLVTYPWAMLVVAVAIYLISLPFAWRAARARRAAAPRTEETSDDA